MWKNSEYKLEAMMTLSATLQPMINFGQSQAPSHAFSPQSQVVHKGETI